MTPKILHRRLGMGFIMANKTLKVSSRIFYIVTTVFYKNVKMMCLFHFQVAEKTMILIFDTTSLN